MENHIGPLYYTRRYAPNLVNKAAIGGIDSNENNVVEDETEAGEDHDIEVKGNTSCANHDDTCPIPYELNSVFVLRYNTHGDLELPSKRKITRLTIDHTTDSFGNGDAKSHTRTCIDVEPLNILASKERVGGSVGYGAVSYKQGCLISQRNGGISHRKICSVVRGSSLC